MDDVQETMLVSSGSDHSLGATGVVAQTACDVVAKSQPALQLGAYLSLPDSPVSDAKRTIASFDFARGCRGYERKDGHRR